MKIVSNDTPYQKVVNELSEFMNVSKGRIEYDPGDNHGQFYRRELKETGVFSTTWHYKYVCSWEYDNATDTLTTHNDSELVGTFIPS